MYKQQAYELSVGLNPSNYLLDNTIISAQSNLEWPQTHIKNAYELSVMLLCQIIKEVTYLAPYIQSSRSSPTTVN
jgi:hypothetical protein